MTHLSNLTDSSNVLLGLFLGRKGKKIFENERVGEQRPQGELVLRRVGIGIEKGYGRD